MRAASSGRRSAERGGRSVADSVDLPRYAGPLEGAERVGEAAAGGRLVQVGVWGRTGALRARYRATTCASLIAYAEAACEALEAGVGPAELDAAALRRRVRGVHPSHRERAALVAAAVRAAFAEELA